MRSDRVSVDVAANLKEVRARLERACRQAGRAEDSVRLLAVSKTKPPALIAAACDAGQRCFGENYVQELLAKQPELPEKIEWHFIGRLQSNKVRQVVGRVAMIHSVDRAKLFDEIDRRACALGLKVDCLLEINVGDERGKAGASDAEALELARHAAALEGVSLCGLMSIPPFLDDPQAMRPFHRRLFELRGMLRDATGLALDELSMGMSTDMEVAIEEGATIVRVGTDIFGPRDYSV
jgi:pyridoxal phosphate enzyme (YggS family)